MHVCSAAGLHTIRVASKVGSRSREVLSVFAKGCRLVCISVPLDGGVSWFAGTEKLPQLNPVIVIICSHCYLQCY